ncbi:hypothetical protein GCM10010095_41260 [Streptomyces anthocyanicus]|uniref:Uncharacterized protein n=1 Tax=Streptomyces violaceolatus TaxID=67378 RepID=A0ABN3SNX9_9ACTN|nr:hypothetical protein SLITK23_73100 [Streptomyces lividans]GGL52146.1 hypothetical protein GCM10010095_41260 [Streptomyces anthocyanicus]GHC13798.1 hypothetical protein GCM10010348_41650 [Streptomyces anthocyanicus]
MGEHAVRPGAGTRHGRRADAPTGSAPSSVLPGPPRHPHPHPIGAAAPGHTCRGNHAGRGPGHGPGVGGTALPDRAKGVPCPVFESRGSWASATPRRKAVS